MIPIKPLSVNEAWKGRRFKTPEYTAYEYMVRSKLPRKLEIPEGKLKIYLTFYLSNKASDYDNPVKPTQDIICAFYRINDNRIYKADIEKIIVPIGSEGFDFRIECFEQQDTGIRSPVEKVSGLAAKNKI